MCALGRLVFRTTKHLAQELFCSSGQISRPSVKWPEHPPSSPLELPACLLLSLKLSPQPPWPFLRFKASWLSPFSHTPFSTWMVTDPRE